MNIKKDLTYLNHDLINFPKIINSSKKNLIDNDRNNIIKNLRIQNQKQEINIKYLNEKLKKIQSEKKDLNLENIKFSKNESVLNLSQVINIILHNIFRLKI